MVCCEPKKLPTVLERRSRKLFNEPSVFTEPKLAIEPMRGSDGAALTIERMRRIIMRVTRPRATRPMTVAAFRRSCACRRGFTPLAIRPIIAAALRRLRIFCHANFRRAALCTLMAARRQRARKRTAVKRRNAVWMRRARPWRKWKRDMCTSISVRMADVGGAEPMSNHVGREGGAEGHGGGGSAESEESTDPHGRGCVEAESV